MWAYSKIYDKNSTQLPNYNYVKKLILLSNIKKVCSKYSPRTTGNVTISLYHKNSHTFLNTVLNYCELMDKNLNIPKVSIFLKRTTLDDWLVDDNNVPANLSQYLNELYPALNRLCLLLTRHTEAQSSEYFHRQCSNVLHDAKMLLITFDDLSN